MTKLGIISDTHGALIDNFIDILKDCDLIIHAGDFDNLRCYEEIKSLNKPMYMVRGNCDNGNWATNIPETLAFPVEDLIFFMLHDINKLSYDFSDADVIISGHTHVYNDTTKQGIRYLNPGSCTAPRASSQCTMMIAYVDGSDIKTEKFSFDLGNKLNF